MLLLDGKLLAKDTVHDILEHHYGNGDDHKLVPDEMEMEGAIGGGKIFCHKNLG